MKNYILLFALLAAVSCKKTTNDAVKQYYFINSLSQTIHVKLYATEADYWSDENVVKEIDVAPNSDTFKINTSEISNCTYIDWYTSDYKCTNWSNNKIGGNIVPAKNILPQNYWSNQYDNNKYLQRSVCLDGDKKLTFWVASNAFKNGGSVWGSLPNDKKNKQLLFKRDFKVFYIKNGDTIKTSSETYDHFTDFSMELAYNNYLQYRIETFLNAPETYKEAVYLTDWLDPENIIYQFKKTK